MNNTDQMKRDAEVGGSGGGSGGGTTEQLYAQYYQSDRKKQWYELNAVAKAQNIVRLIKSLESGGRAGGGLRILDVGAGNGSVLQRVHDAGVGAELCAVEISESGLGELRRRQRESMPRLKEVKQFDGVHIPFADDSFDVAIASHVIEHVEHPRLFLYEVRRVAKYLYAEVPLEDVSFGGRLGGDWVLDDTGHINYYTKDIFKRLLQTSGWKPKSVEVVLTGADVHVFMKGKVKGTIEHGIKRAMLGVMPGMAQRLFVYFCATLSERTEKISLSLGEVLPAYDQREGV